MDILSERIPVCAYCFGWRTETEIKMPRAAHAQAPATYVFIIIFVLTISSATDAFCFFLDFPMGFCVSFVPSNCLCHVLRISFANILPSALIHNSPIRRIDNSSRDLSFFSIRDYQHRCVGERKTEIRLKVYATSTKRTKDELPACDRRPNATKIK